MGVQADIIGYFWQAGLIVKLVMLILLSASIVSWTFIIQRALYFKRKKKEYQAFMRRFTRSKSLNRLFEDLETEEEGYAGLSAIFHAGFKELMRSQKQGSIQLGTIQRSMQINHAKEAETLERHLPFFSSLGSIAPYIGLFGTVWGIMVSLQALGQAQQATIAMVAPGISEALVATALGLFTAIPATMAFHRYSTHANDLLNRSELFQEELLALITGQSHTTAKPSTLQRSSAEAYNDMGISPEVAHD